MNSDAAVSVLAPTLSVAWTCAVEVITPPLGGVTKVKEVGVNALIAMGRTAERDPRCRIASKIGTADGDRLTTGNRPK